MPARLKLAIPLLLTVLCIALFAVPRLRYYWADDETRVRMSLEGLAQGGRDRHIGEILTHISEHYSDRWHSDRNRLADSLRYILIFRYKRVNVDLSDIEIEFDPKAPDQALTRCKAIILGSTRGNEIPSEPFVRKIRSTDLFELVWRREGSHWRVVEARAPRKSEKKR